MNKARQDDAEEQHCSRRSSAWPERRWIYSPSTRITVIYQENYKPYQTSYSSCKHSVLSPLTTSIVLAESVGNRLRYPTIHRHCTRPAINFIRERLAGFPQTIHDAFYVHRVDVHDSVDLSLRCRFFPLLQHGGNQLPYLNLNAR